MLPWERGLYVNVYICGTLAISDPMPAVTQTQLALTGARIKELQDKLIRKAGTMENGMLSAPRWDMPRSTDTVRQIWGRQRSPLIDGLARWMRTQMISARRSIS